MIEALFGLVPTQGPTVLFVATFLSCLALPIPSSLLMLAAGAFVASGDLDLIPVAGAALAGAILGDQVGFGIGRFGGTRFWEGLVARPRSGRLAARAEAALRARMLSTVYLSRWLFSALGPWVNFASGSMHLAWRPFTLASILGEATWVALYVGLGFAFAAKVEYLGATVPSVLGALTAAVVALILGRAIFAGAPQHRDG